MIVRVELFTMFVVISGEDVCCSVVFGTLVSVSVFSVIWSELLMPSAIIAIIQLLQTTIIVLCVTIVRVPESGVCVHISGED